MKRHLANSPTLTMLGRIQELHAFFRSRTRAQMLATASPFHTPWLAPGYGQKLWEAALAIDFTRLRRYRTTGRAAAALVAKSRTDSRPAIAAGASGPRPDRAAAAASCHPQRGTAADDHVHRSGALQLANLCEDEIEKVVAAPGGAGRQRRPGRRPLPRR